LTFEVDRLGNGEWTIEREIEAPSRGGTGVWVHFDRNVDAEWIRVRCNASLKNATCFFQYRNNDTRTDAPSPIFNGLATVEDAANFLSARAWVRADNDRLAVVSQIIKNDKLQEERYYELSENAELERVPCVYEGGEAGTISRVKAKVDAQPLDSAIATIDDLSVCLTYGERKWRLPIGSDATAKLETAVTRRIDREVATERDLFHYAGIFYELPAENAGGLPMIRPIATHNFVITDYASYRGLLVLSGVASDSARDSDHIVRSEDGQCALWLGAIDDLWSLGKPVGHGYVWRETKVAKGEPSDPFLATGFDRKSLVLTNHCDEDVEVTLQADATGYEHWRAYKVVKVKANSQETLVLHDDFGAFWLRCVCDKDATLSAEFIYN
ncbi:MAG: hypothetical protein Q4G03_08290, partial [Planctomycetia bacterium]|nr:hypothetical protein [Planctomycetia bacterium]